MAKTCVFRLLFQLGNVLLVFVLILLSLPHQIRINPIAHKMSYDLVALGNPLLDMQIRGGEKVLEKVRIGKVKGGEEIAD